MPIYKDHKTGKWLAVFYFYDAFGARHHKTKRGFLREKDAKEYEHNFLANRADDPSITFEALAENYLEYCKPRRKPTTYYNKQYLIHKHMIPKLGHLPIKDISAKVIQAWQTCLQTNKHAYAPTYLYTLNNLLASIFKFGVITQGLKVNPVIQAGKLGKATNTHNDFWTPDEFNAFIAALKNDEANKAAQIKRHVCTDHLVLGFNLLFYGGMRLGEMLAITLNDINFDNNSININKTYVRLNGQDIIQIPKTESSNRIVDMPSAVMILLEKYVRSLPSDYPHSDRLFITLGKNNMSRAIKSTCKLIDLKPIRLHDIRHSHASLLYYLGVPLKEASERLGHAQIKTTLDIYTHLYSDQQRNVAKKIDEIIKQ